MVVRSFVLTGNRISERFALQGVPLIVYTSMMDEEDSQLPLGAIESISINGLGMIIDYGGSGQRRRQFRWI